MPKNFGGMSYTRQKYVHSIPQSMIRRFTLGNTNEVYSHATFLKATSSKPISSRALEAARVTANKIMERSGHAYFLKILVYPHEVIREHKFMGFAGADRLSRGMSKSFGRPTSRAAKVVPGQKVLAIYTQIEGVDPAKTALKRASKKLPITHNLVVEQIVNEEEQNEEQKLDQ